MLLPEEVLALGNSAKESPTSWQLNVLGQLLKQASQKASAAQAPRTRQGVDGAREESSRPCQHVGDEQSLVD